MSPAQRVQWIVQMQNTMTQKMSGYLEDTQKKQDKRYADTRKSLEDIKKALENLQSRFQVEVVQKTPAFKLRHLKLSHRLLVVMKQIELLRLRNRSTSTIEEEVWRSKLENFKRELDRPDQYSGRLKELSSKVKLQDSGGIAVPSYESLDGDSLDQIVLYLEEQREGLEKLIQVLDDDMKDIGLIHNGLQQENFNTDVMRL